MKKLFSVEKVSFFPIYLMDLATTFSVKRLLGLAATAVINFYRGTNLVMHVDKQSWQKLCDNAQERLIKDKLFYGQIKRGMIKECKILKIFSDKLLKLKPRNLSDQQLIGYYEDFEKKTLALRAYALIPNLVDMGQRSIFDIVEAEVQKQIGLNHKIKEYISKLTTPTEITEQRRHELNLYKIQFLIQKKRIKDWQHDPAIERLIKSHLKKYRWLAYYYIGPAWSEKDIVEILRNNLKLVQNAQTKIKEIKNYPQKIKQEKNSLQKELKLKRETISLLDKIAAMIFLKTYRKEFLIYSNYCFEPILKEIGRRLNLSLAEARFLTKTEIKRYLLNKKFFNKEIKKQIQERLAMGCVSVIWQNKIKLLPSKAMKEYSRLIEEDDEKDRQQIKGNCAYPGKAEGIAKVINLKEEVWKIKKGEILVSRATNPDLIVAMQKAAAFVTDEGGITCHAAIIAREMQKPCIIGAKIATKIIKDGDLIDVDAGKGVANILKKA